MRKLTGQLLWETVRSKLVRICSTSKAVIKTGYTILFRICFIKAILLLIKIPTFFNTPLICIQSMQGIVLSPSYWKPLRPLISIAFSAKPRYLVPACESELERTKDLHQVGWQRAPLPCTWRVKYMRLKENLGRGRLTKLSNCMPRN